MTSIHIRHMANRFRIPAAAWSERRRIARIFETATFDLLDAALADAGVDAQEEICIRRVSAFVRLQLAGTDYALARAWSQALADAILSAARTPHAGVVRYHSRAQALVDLVTSFLHGDLSRAWAWADLELWPRGACAGDRIDARAVLRALTLHPTLAVAVLAAVGRRHKLDRLILDAPPELWIELARAVLIEITGGDAMLDVPSSGLGRSDAGKTAGATFDLVAIAESILHKSAIASAIRRQQFQLVEPALTRGVVALAIAESEPWRLQNPSRADDLVNVVAKVLIRESMGAQEIVRDESETREGRNDTSIAAPTAQADEVVSPRPVTTEFGGLLFLLHVVAACDLPAIIEADAALVGRSLRWVLHQLAIVLTGCAGDDPAPLAFAGLRPSDVPPDRDEQSVSEHEADALARYAQQIVERLSEIFAGDDDREPISRVAWICERHAEIVSDPGWIEARFSHSDADTSIRRHGLDLNPDFIPWLGVVMRFAYVG